MAKKPFFSIIIPTLNEQKYLPNLLTDLSKQTYQDFEVIIADGHSEDKTVAKATKLAAKLPSLKIINSDIRQVCTQRNLGAKKSRAATLVFMDADNRIPPNFLSGIKYRWEESGVDLLTSRFQPDLISPLNLSIASTINLFFELQNNLKPTYLLEAMFVVSRKCFNAINGFDESVNYAEGKSIIQTATKLNFKAVFARDPIWTFSFRRIRKYGVLSITRSIVSLELYSLLGLDPKQTKLENLYPMKGGSFYAESRRQAILAKLQKKLKSKSAQNKLISRLNALLSSLKSDQ